MAPARPPRIILIAPRFQWRLVAEFLLLQVFLTAIFALGLYLFMDSEIQANLASAHVRYRSFSQMMVPVVSAVAGFNILLSTVLVTLYVLRLTHRIARPLLRVRASLEELSRRRILVHTGIGEGAELFELSASLRGALEAVRGDIHALRARTALLRAALERGDSEQASQQLETLEDLARPWHEADAETGQD